MLAQRYEEVKKRVEQACIRAGREPDSVRILPVSKTFGPDVLQEAINAGLRRFGENKVQEMKQKAEVFHEYPIEWVIIGYMQTNKAKEVARYAAEVQSMDRLDLALALDKRLQLENRTIDVLVQVKTSPEESKTGMPAEAVPAFLQELKAMQTLRPMGLMTVAENSDSEAKVRACFAALRHLRQQCQDQTGLALPTLSMGMSGDFEWAIQEGSTEVRIGSAIFGQRDYA
ncbi:YggS family pyridoxal phosphate-dependent enzyme [Advenella sp. RU8]|uniref:YggS family pyridoxal phosphate-dependent enzyme n=1 Tax=Advenella sp. RU8 TaxID=3399575 RepID=UPI003AAC8CB0